MYQRSLYRKSVTKLDSNFDDGGGSWSLALSRCTWQEPQELLVARNRSPTSSIILSTCVGSASLTICIVELEVGNMEIDRSIEIEPGSDFVATVG